MTRSVAASDAISIKRLIHQRLLESIDLTDASRMSRELFQEECSRRVSELVRTEGLDLDDAIRDQVVRELLDDIFGLGPLESILADRSVSDILVNAPDEIWVERNGRLSRANISFDDSGHLMTVIHRIVRSCGRRIDVSTPLVDARLPDGSRVNVVIPPLAIDGPQLCIRRFTKTGMTLDHLSDISTLDPQVADFLGRAVTSRASMVISGGAGAGKTTTLNALAGFIPEGERIITIEDAAELRLPCENVVRLESRLENVEGSGAIDARTLVRNALRMRPDRIIVGECRGGEAFDMLQAMNTGHEGSMTTIHANGAADSLLRLENMLAMTGLDIPVEALRGYLVSAIDIVVQMVRLPGGRRVIESVTEVQGIEGGMIKLGEIYRFVHEGIDEHGDSFGHFECTGLVPEISERIRRMGLDIDDRVFSAARLSDVRGPIAKDLGA